jgi:DNA gyrase/topoisomerase IV subunit B
MTFEESVRKRPGMYIGNDGIVGLVTGLLNDCIEFSKTDKIVFEIAIGGDNDFYIGISSDQDLGEFLKLFTIECEDPNSYLPRTLRILSDRFEIISSETNKTEVRFSVDKTVITDTSVDYLKLTDAVIQVALLNRQTEIITIDKRQTHLNQNYYHFPQGVFYLFDRATTEVLGRPEFKLTFDGQVSTNKYQIGLAYRTDWYPTPSVNSFANNIHTICGGSLVDGILDGLISACKSYVNENNLVTHKIKRKKFLNGLISAVRGADFKYGGSFKETLEDDQVRAQTKKVVKHLTLDYFKNQNDKADKFLSRFDEAGLTSKMY